MTKLLIYFVGLPNKQISLKKKKLKFTFTFEQLGNKMGLFLYELSENQ